MIRYRPMFSQLRPAGMKLGAGARKGPSEPIYTSKTSKAKARHALIVMPAEQKFETKKRTIHSGLSFLDLPLEIRLMIYGICLTDDVNGKNGISLDQPIVRNQGEITQIVGNPCSCKKPNAVIIPGVDPVLLPHMGLETTGHGPWKPAGLVVGILRLNKQIHDEAAPVLYGSNTFEFQIGLNRHNWHVADYNNMCRREHFDFIDNFVDLAPQYLRMVKKCSLRIRLLTTPYVIARTTYLRALERVQAFTTILSQGHSLQKLSASLVQPRTYLYHRGRRVSFFENVLEPLGTLHGIRDVQIENVTPVFEVKLTMALKGPEPACRLAEEIYGKKMVKVQGRRRPRICKLRTYHESRYIWKPYFEVVEDEDIQPSESQRL